VSLTKQQINIHKPYSTQYFFVHFFFVIVLCLSDGKNLALCRYPQEFDSKFLFLLISLKDRLCGLVVRVLGYRSGGPGSIPGTTRKKKVVGLERGPLSLLSTTEELLDRKVVAPV
jgi:hypothetical protein